MRKLDLRETQLDFQLIALIASCVDKIEELELDADKGRLQVRKILSTANNNRSSPVS